ncbi:MAG TPA: bifunctional diaminohydroxyphosphoribosylaminopyrimidine deaminase/5-amino-6-(5-phosphoribosylamino)uracil reductase RibD [Candidatus Baltobacteraceae bacterium]
MEGRGGTAVANAALDGVFMQRACELAMRGRGSTSPNPIVGAVIVRDGHVIGEGFHHRRGSAHAEVEALRACESDPKGATIYVTLEPCNHHGLTPPCTEALIAANPSRVVVGVLDPNPKTAGGGVRRLRDARIQVDVTDSPMARALIEDFAVAISHNRPFVTLKLATSLDGYVASRQGQRLQLSGERAFEFVRELRIAHDAVMVGAGTVRTDDPLLTVRPPHARAKPYVRIVACEAAPVSPASRVFVVPESANDAVYARTIVLAPTAARAAFADLESVADVIYVGDRTADKLDLFAALVALKGVGIASVLSEGGPTIAMRLLAQGLVDRLHWIVAPMLLAGEDAVPALTPESTGLIRSFSFDTPARLDDDILLSASLKDSTAHV